MKRAKHRRIHRAVYEMREMRVVVVPGRSLPDAAVDLIAQRVAELRRTFELQYGA